VTAAVEKIVANLGGQIDVAFCPDRIAEGKAMTELSSCRRSSPAAPGAALIAPARYSGG